MLKICLSSIFSWTFPKLLLFSGFPYYWNPGHYWRSPAQWRGNASETKAELYWYKLPSKSLVPLFQDFMGQICCDRKTPNIEQIYWRSVVNGVKFIYEMSWTVEYMATEQTDPYHTNSQNVKRCVQWQCSQTSSDSINDKCWWSWQNTALAKWKGKEKSWVLWTI